MMTSPASSTPWTFPTEAWEQDQNSGVFTLKMVDEREVVLEPLSRLPDAERATMLGAKLHNPYLTSPELFPYKSLSYRVQVFFRPCFRVIRRSGQQFLGASWRWIDCQRFVDRHQGGLGQGAFAHVDRPPILTAQAGGDSALNR